MSIEAFARHLRRSGYELVGDVYRHPGWPGWVRWSEVAWTWVASDANGVERHRPDLAVLLRESGAPPLVGAP